MLKKTLFSLLVFSLLGASIGFGWHAVRDGFDIRRISICPQAGAPAPIPHSIVAIFQQPFTYLSRGRQSFAFVSRDGNYVLKLPRSDRPKVPFWKKALFPESAWRASWEKKQLRRKKALASFQLAYSELREETGLVYLHLERTDGELEVEIVDRIGRRHTVFLDKTLFLLQRKFPLAFAELDVRSTKGDEAGIQSFLSAFLDMAYSRAKKGIFNSDSTFLMNFGIEGEHIYQIDVGSFRVLETISREDAFVPCFLEASSQLKRWVAPEWAGWIDERVEKMLVER